MKRMIFFLVMFVSFANAKVLTDEMKGELVNGLALAFANYFGLLFSIYLVYLSFAKIRDYLRRNVIKDKTNLDPEKIVVTTTYGGNYSSINHPGNNRIVI